MDIGPLHIVRSSGTSVEHYGRRITPEHLVVRLEIPSIQGGVIYNRAIAVRVDEPDQPTRTLPILNFTLLGQIVFVGIGIYAALIFLLWRKS